MRVEEGKLFCFDGHEHPSSVGLYLCEGNSRSYGPEILVRPSKKTMKYEGRTFSVCPAGQWHDGNIWDAVDCGGELRLVKAEVDHDGKRWVVASCRHLHPEGDVVKVIFCKHGDKKT